MEKIGNDLEFFLAVGLVKRNPPFVKGGNALPSNQVRWKTKVVFTRREFKLIVKVIT